MPQLLLVCWAGDLLVLRGLPTPPRQQDSAENPWAAVGGTVLIWLDIQTSADSITVGLLTRPATAAFLLWCALVGSVSAVSTDCPTLTVPGLCSLRWVSTSGCLRTWQAVTAVNRPGAELHCR